MTARMRTGVVGKKLGMTNVFTPEGNTLPVTLIELVDNYVAGNYSVANDNKIKIAYDELAERKVRKSSFKLETTDGVKYFRHVKEFRVSGDELPEQGKKIAIEHFQEGQLVDVTGTSIGKGFAGAMKRHNFAGLEATHGISISHRSHGSTGQCQDPGRVFKGKKMAGQMGNKQVTVQNLTVMKIDAELNVIAVVGAIPGAKNSTVIINDAVKSFVDDSAPFPAAYVEPQNKAEATKPEAKEEATENLEA